MHQSSQCKCLRLWISTFEDHRRPFIPVWLRLIRGDFRRSAEITVNLERESRDRTSVQELLPLGADNLGMGRFLTERLDVLTFHFLDVGVSTTDLEACTNFHCRRR